MIKTVQADNKIKAQISNAENKYVIVGLFDNNDKMLFSDKLLTDKLYKFIDETLRRDTSIPLNLTEIRNVGYPIWISVNKWGNKYSMSDFEDMAMKIVSNAFKAKFNTEKTPSDINTDYDKHNRAFNAAISLKNDDKGNKSLVNPLDLTLFLYRLHPEEMNLSTKITNFVTDRSPKDIDGDMKRKITDEITGITNGFLKEERRILKNEAFKKNV